MGSSCCCAVEQSTHLLLCRILVPVVSLPVQCTAFQHQGTTVLSPWDSHFWFGFVSASEAPQYFFLCPTYFTYYNILHFHLFSHKWQDFWLASCIVLLSTFCLSVHPSMHTAIESFPWLLYNKHGVHRPLLHWFHLV